MPYFGIGILNSIASTARAAGAIGPTMGAAAALSATSAPGAAVSGPVSAGLGNAATVGKLAVPSAWPSAGLTPTADAVAAPLVSDVVESETPLRGGSLLGGMPLANPDTSAAGNGPHYGFRPKVMIRPPFAG